MNLELQREQPCVDRAGANRSTHVGQCSVGVTVRRERRGLQRCNSRPGTGSFHPVTIETAAKATKLSELSMERVVKRLGGEPVGNLFTHELLRHAQETK